MSYCKALGFDLSAVFLGANVKCSKEFTKGAVLEIFNLGKSKQLEYLKIIQIIAKITEIDNVNMEACLSKIHRIASADKKKGGQLREQFRGEEFVVPINSERISMSVPVRSLKQESEKHFPKNESIKLSSLSERLQERRKQVMELTKKKTKQLKRKLERKEKQIEVSNAKKS